MWIEIQAIATICAFIAAAVYAWIARGQMLAMRQLLGIEQTPVLIVTPTDRHIRNIGRGPALVSFFRSVEDLRTVGIVLPSNIPLLGTQLPDKVGLSDDRLYYRDAGGVWHCTKLILHDGRLNSNSLGAIVFAIG